MLRFPIAFFQKMVSPRLGLAVIVVILAIICTTVTVFAHPLGNFTVNRYSRLEIGATELELLYVIDMAEIPSHRLRTEIDSNGDGVLSAAEQQQFLAVEAERLAQNFTLTINGQSVVLQHQMLNLHFVEGQQACRPHASRRAFSRTLRQRQWQSHLTITTRTLPGNGWQEVVVQAVDGIALVNSDVPASDLSDELRNYPTDLLTNPPVVNGAKVDFRLGAVGDGKTSGQGDKVTGATGATGIAKPADGFAELIKTEVLTPWAILLAIVAAFGWGAAHAMSPGHGKTIVGADPAGRRGTVNHAVFLGLTTTITHTAGVFGLGLVTLFLSNFILPEAIWLGVASGLMIVTLGLALLESSQIRPGHRQARCRTPSS